MFTIAARFSICSLAWHLNNVYRQIGFSHAVQHKLAAFSFCMHEQGTIYLSPFLLGSACFLFLYRKPAPSRPLFHTELKNTRAFKKWNCKAGRERAARRVCEPWGGMVQVSTESERTSWLKSPRMWSMRHPH